MVRAAVSSLFKSSKSLCVLFWKVGRDAEWFPLPSQLNLRHIVLLGRIVRIAAYNHAEGRIHFGCQTKQSSSSSFWISRLFPIVFALKRSLSDGLIVFRSSFLERLEAPAKSVRKPPGSTMVTFTPKGATSFANVSEKPSTPHFAAIRRTADWTNAASDRGNLDKVS